MSEGRLLFAQISDVHVTSNVGGVPPEQVERNVLEAARDLSSLPERAEFVLATGDLVVSGAREELRRYLELAAHFPCPVHNLPGSHDRWRGPEPWEELLGPRFYAFDVGGTKFICLDANKPLEEGKWLAAIEGEQLEWLKRELDRAKVEGKGAIVALHPPPRRMGGEYLDQWRGSNADEFLSVLREAKVLALLTGHWHRTWEWTEGGVRVVNTGALCGWQWNGFPPFYGFPTRPGYRLFWLDSEELRTFWRDLYCPVQVSLVKLGEANFMGPRPQARRPVLRGRARLLAQAFGMRAEAVEALLQVDEGPWRPMEPTWRGLWTDFEATLDAAEIPEGEHVLTVKAIFDDGSEAFDHAPLLVSHAPSGESVEEGPELLFAPFVGP